MSTELARYEPAPIAVAHERSIEELANKITDQRKPMTPEARARKNARARARYQGHPEKRLAQMRAWRKANPEKNRVSVYKWRKANPEKARAAMNKWRAANPERYRVPNRKWARALAGWTEQMFAEALVAQAGVCAICGMLRGKKGLGADHCHVSGKPRALLCGPCNSVIGLMQDDPTLLEKAAAYLRQYQEKRA